MFKTEVASYTADTETVSEDSVPFTAILGYFLI